MTDISVHYYDADATEWVDLTPYATRFHIEDYGIQKFPIATVNFDTTRANLNAYLTNPYRLTRIRVKPSTTWQNIFFGYIDKPYLKTSTGTFTERSRLSLDMVSFASRLAQDYITFNYYELQSALSPYTGTESWTFRDMIQDFLDYPDSRDDDFPYGTMFTVEAATDINGIDATIDGTGNWDNQTLLEAIRIVCEHIGYDGYYNLADETSTPKVKLYPFNKTSTATITNPFLGEPEWAGGSLSDVANKIFVEGGIDAGIPSDGDKWTEWAAAKYNPSVWTAWTDSGYASVSDPLNSNFTKDGISYGAGTRCVKFITDSTNQTSMSAALNLLNTENGDVDCLNRCTSLDFAFYPYTGDASYEAFLIIMLKDTADNTIIRVCKPADTPLINAFHHATPYTLSIPFLSEEEIHEASVISALFYSDWNAVFNASSIWYYYGSSTTFDWEHVKYAYFTVRNYTLPDVDVPLWSFEIDALLFAGGKKISQFNPLNPPAFDQTSIDTYGMHPYKHSDAQITSFEQAQAEAARILNNLHNPIPTFSIKKLYGTDTYGNVFATQLYPSDVVTVLGTDYRIANTIYDWDTRNHRVEAEYNSVLKTSPLPPIWSRENELRLHMK